MKKIAISTFCNSSDISPISPNSSIGDKLTVTEKTLVDEGLSNDSSLLSKIANNTSFSNLFLELLKDLATRQEQERYHKVIDDLVTQLVIDLKRFSEDEDYFFLIERNICDIEHNYSFETMGTVIQTVYVNYNDKPKVLVGICKALCRYDLQEVMPWGPTMLSGLLNNKSETVKEHAIELVENWSDVSMLPLLKNLEVSSKWLKDYLQDVINNLEG